MSFKRDGDDKCLLANLQRQRVSELLATHIPEDEAMLLKNGRYACTVCVCRPIFDTLDMMALHRKGKKHLANLSKFLVRQNSRKELILKRKQEQFLKTGSATIHVAKTPKPVSLQSIAGTSSKMSSLLKASPYSSCCRRRTKPMDRKVMLDTGQMKHTAEKVSPECSRNLPESKSGTSLVKAYIKEMSHKSSFESKVEKSRQSLSWSDFKAERCKEHCGSGGTEEMKKTDCDPDDYVASTETPVMTEEQRKQANYYLNLRRDGWKKTFDGKWIRDEDAEFESDEDMPPDYSTV